MNELDLLRYVDALKMRVEELEKATRRSHYKGTSAIDFTTTTLPRHGDYGFQTADNELQMNCNGTIRAVAMAGL